MNKKTRIFVWNFFLMIVYCTLIGTFYNIISFDLSLKNFVIGLVIIFTFYKVFKSIRKIESTM